jgi:O-antigen ligase
MSLVIGALLHPKDFKWLIYLLAFEGLVGITEFIIGVNTFFDLESKQVFSLSNLMYDRRVMGLSDGVNNYGIKLFVGSLLLERYKELFSNKIYKILKMIFIGSILLGFSRTVVLAYLVFQIIIFYAEFRKLYMIGNHSFSVVLKRFKYFFLSITLLSIGVYFTYYYLDNIILQVTRGRGHIELSGRDLIWEEALSFIKEHIFWGNGSFKYRMNIFGKTMHAHNSFLQILANHGLFLGLYFIFFIVLNIRKNEWIYVIPIFILSYAQYGVFWGVSLLDIVLFSFIVNLFLTEKNDIKNIVTHSK